MKQSADPPEPASEQAAPHAPAIRSPRDLAVLSVAALGVVYGDIGTSPLYAIKECFSAPHGVEITAANVLGIVSLFLWSLTLVIVLKYMSFVMRADNHGEGGILALLALLKPRNGASSRPALALYITMGLFGAALLYGDGVITPAISVLSAVEGLGVATPVFTKPVIVSFTVVILVILFLAQKRGTAGVGALFGPAMLVWFFTIGALGAAWTVRHPEILRAVSPVHAVSFFARHKLHGFFVLGAVVLCITGGEALYADMGHFGKKPIRAAWFLVVFPALLLNYFGQGARMLAALEAGPDDLRQVAESPFYALASGAWRYPLIAIATFATIVASQALISGAYSLTQQAVQLGYWPRVTIKHTSGRAEGQIYIPEINAALMVGCIVLVLTFQESSKLAAAYGLAVTGTMSITSVLFYGVARSWGWSAWTTGLLVGAFLLIDFAFLGANVHKLAEGPGAWFPIVVGASIFTLMTTWYAGRNLLGEQIRAATLPMSDFLASLAVEKPHRVRGTAIFMTSNPDGAPPALLHHFKHNQVLHEQVVLLSIQTRHVPEVSPSARVERITDLGSGLYQVVAAYGFMQTPNVMDVLERCRKQGFKTDKARTSFFLGRETLVVLPESRPGTIAVWRKRLFSFMSRNARPANAFFQIPSNRVVELGTQIEL